MRETDYEDKVQLSGAAIDIKSQLKYYKALSEVSLFNI